MSSNPTEGVVAEVVSSDVAATGGSHFHPLTVRSIEQDTRDAVTLTFNVPAHLEDEFRFTQGQYLTLRAHIGGEEVRRSYSICSAVQDRRLRVAVKRTPGGVFSNWIVEHTKPGDTIEVMPPEGRFHVPLSPHHEKQYVAFAAGSGITPIFSIIKTTLLTEPNSGFTLFYGNRASNTVILREELAEIKDRFMDRFSLIHIMSREQQDVDAFNGRITGEKSELLLKQWCPLEHVDTVFLCGPQEMVDEVSGTLKALGFPPSRIKIELFTVNASEAKGKLRREASAAEAECEVTVIVDGSQQVFSMQRGNETVLDAALRRGIDLRHSCKSGVCATCRAKLVRGQVDMDANYALEDYEVARGFILSCQSYPVTDQITVDFDQDN